MTNGDRSDETPATSPRSAVSDELDVPDEPPDPATTDHVLEDEQLCYPDFTFEEGTISPVDGFALDRSLTRSEMCEWLTELAGGLTSHDIGVSTPTSTAIFGVGAQGVSMAFEPDENHRGILEVTFRLPAKVMTLSNDPDVRVAGSRGGVGFIPKTMLTTDQELFRCYNWIEDPIDGK